MKINQSMFINYDPRVGVSISSFRSPEGYFNDDVIGLVEDVMAGRPGCAPLEGSLEALEDGSILQGLEQWAVEDLHAELIGYENV